MLKLELVAPLRPVAAAVKVYPLPERLILRPEKLATPLEAAPVVVPESVPPLGLDPIATVTFPEKLVATFPAASSAET